ncbi:PaaI family thioesterase [Achromobacter spanius]|uniref:Phenylacetic acid degradation protein n=1 Tax=Achromobacter spanius TaxID=217203 RepID=A0A2S0IDD4_9BURK|nr:PaaI family thioesterase [Achromobacter spanius]AVJ30049.1 phenylacetic acid degradation protein [Achromobacter spanius]
MDTQSADESAVPPGWRQRTLPGFAGLIGPLWVRKNDDGWAYGLLATSDHLNPAGVVHGGLLTALLDHGISAIAWEALGRRACVTVQLDTHFLAAALEGQFLEVRGRVVRATSSLVFMQGELSTDGEVVATAVAVLKQIGPPRNAAGEAAAGEAAAGDPAAGGPAAGGPSAGTPAE